MGFASIYTHVLINLTDIHTHTQDIRKMSVNILSIRTTQNTNYTDDGNQIRTHLIHTHTNVWYTKMLGSASGHIWKDFWQIGHNTTCTRCLLAWASLVQPWSENRKCCRQNICRHAEQRNGRKSRCWQDFSEQWQPTEVKSIINMFHGLVVLVRIQFDNSWKFDLHTHMHRDRHTQREKERETERERERGYEERERARQRYWYYNKKRREREGERTQENRFTPSGSTPLLLWWKSMMYDVWCMVYDVWWHCMMYDVWCDPMSFFLLNTCWVFVFSSFEIAHTHTHTQHTHTIRYTYIHPHTPHMHSNTHTLASH